MDELQEMMVMSFKMLQLPFIFPQRVPLSSLRELVSFSTFSVYVRFNSPRTGDKSTASLLYFAYLDTKRFRGYGEIPLNDSSRMCLYAMCAVIIKCDMINSIIVFCEFILRFIIFKVNFVQIRIFNENISFNLFAINWIKEGEIL